MTSLGQAWRCQLDLVRRHPVVCSLVLVTAVVVIGYGMEHDRTVKAVAYVAAMGLGAFVVDLFAQRSTDRPELPVRRPRVEALVVLGCIAIGYLGLFAQKVFLDWSATTGLLRSAVVVSFGFVFPVFIALIMLWLKYKPRDLGFRLNASCWVALPILFITAGTAWLVAREDIKFGLVYEEEGLLGLLVMGFITAGLSEEFSRMLMQTRVGAWLKNPAIGWYIATVLWAFLHAPNWIGNGSSAYEATMSCIRIVPLGLLWGYMTHRTRSLLPATFVHGLNMWGLQNF